MNKPDKRSEILQAAMELLTEEGFHGAPMAQIARRAGVAAGTIYCYFASREELIRAIEAELERTITERLRVRDDMSLPPEKRFRGICSVLLDYFIENPLEFRYLEQFHNSPFGVEHRRDKIFGRAGDDQFIREVFLKWGAAGDIKDLPLAVHFALTFGPLVAVARDHNLGFITLTEDLRGRFIGACWDSIKSR